MMGSVAVHPAAARLAAFPHVFLRQELIRRLSRWMPPFMLLPAVASIGAMTLCGTSVLRVLDGLGLTLAPDYGESLRFFHQKLCAAGVGMIWSQGVPKVFGGRTECGLRLAAFAL